MLTVLGLTILISLSAQNHKDTLYSEHLSANKNSLNVLYRINTGYPTTGLVAKIPSGETFTDSYIIVQADTLYLTADPHEGGDEQWTYSNLITFAKPIDGFTFYPGNIGAPVWFSYIDSRLPEQNETPTRVKKKMPDVQNL